MGLQTHPPFVPLGPRTRHPLHLAPTAPIVRSPEHYRRDRGVETEIKTTDKVYIFEIRIVNCVLIKNSLPMRAVLWYKLVYRDVLWNNCMVWLSMMLWYGVKSLGTMW